MKKGIVYSGEARKGLLMGVTKLSKAVLGTLGASGRNVLIEGNLNSPFITKDGVTVARAVELQDRLEAQGANLLKEAAIMTNNIAGDGTTTSIALASSLLEAIFREMKRNKSLNPVLIKKELDIISEEIQAMLVPYTLKISTSNKEKLEHIATISANGDSKVGKTLAGIFNKLGKDGDVKLSRSKNRDTYVEYLEGFSFNSSLLDENLKYSDEEVLNLKDVHILITDKTISDKNYLSKEVFSQFILSKKPLVIICEEMHSSLLYHFSIQNKTVGSKIYIIVAPGFAEQRFKLLDDIAKLTGGHYFTGAYDLASCVMGDLGRAKSLIIGKDKVSIIEGQGNKTVIKNRLNSLKRKILKSKDDYEKLELQERISKLSGGLAILHLGAKTDVEFVELSSRTMDSLNATKAAITDGIIAGGGVPLWKISNKLKESSSYSKYKNVAIKVLKKSLSTPLQVILGNAGLDISLHEKNIKKGEFNYGYDVRNDKYGNMIDLGVVDPIKVTLCALENALSVVGTLITTECVIYNEEVEDDTSFSV